MEDSGVPSLCIFFHDFSATGVVRNALAVGRHMDKSGWCVTLIACREDGELKVEAEGLNRVVLLQGSRGRASRSIDLLSCVHLLRRALKSLRPDICLGGGNHAHLPLWLSTRGMRLPLRAYRISNDLAHGGRGRISPRRLSARLFASDARRLILVSPALGEEPLLKTALLSGKAVVIPNGVDVAKARYCSVDPDFACPWRLDGDPVILAAGRMVDQKNFERLVEAAALANESRPLRLVIMGKGTAAAREELVRKANICGLGERLELPGVVSNPFAAMKHAAVVVLPSLWEGSPNVLLEAMAVGVPVIASRTAGNAAEILGDGRYGLLVDPLSKKAIAEAILSQLDPKSRVMPGERARQYDQHVSLEAYRKTFMELAGEDKVRSL